MTIKGNTSVLLAICVSLILWIVAYADGGIRQLITTNALILIFALSFPFLVLWAAANGAKGKAVPQATIVISIVFIVLDAMVNIGPGSRLGDSIGSVVTAGLASLEVLLPLTMVVCALVSRARSEDSQSNIAK